MGLRAIARPWSAALLAIGIAGLFALSAAPAVAGPEPSVCGTDQASLCDEIQPAGTGEFQLTLYTPNKTPAADEIKTFELETTVPTNELRPHNLCTAAGSRTGSGPDGTVASPFQGKYYIIKCKTAIKAGDTFRMCFNDGNVTLPTTPAGTYAFFSAAEWGAGYVGVVPAASHCSAPPTQKLPSASKKKKHKPTKKKKK
jgi:hypothetical protein